MKQFKLVRTYHKPYRIFNEDFIINIGNINPINKNQEILDWLHNNMNYCYSPLSKKEVMCSEFPTWKYFLDSNVVDDNTYISLQHYSKILDLNSINDTPYRDTVEYENEQGSRFANCKSLADFGYTKENIENILNKYDIIAGNNYPCNICASINVNMNENCNKVINSYIKIVDAINSNIFTYQRLRQYFLGNYQYWRGGPLITTVKDYRLILDFSFTMLNAFIFSRDVLNQTLFKNKDGRGVGYIMEMIVGFAIFCLIEEYKLRNKKIGYCRLLTDSNIIFGNTHK